MFGLETFLGPLLGGLGQLNSQKANYELQMKFHEDQMRRQRELDAELAPLKQRKRFEMGIYEPREKAAYEKFLLNRMTSLPALTGLTGAVVGAINSRADKRAPFHVRGQENVPNFMQEAGAFMPALMQYTSQYPGGPNSGQSNLGEILLQQQQNRSNIGPPPVDPGNGYLNTIGGGLTAYQMAQLYGGK